MILFDSLPTSLYLEYLNRAEAILNIGLHSDKTVIQLAKHIYETEGEKWTCQNLISKNY